MSTFKQRVQALMGSMQLPQMTVDLACYRRLLAMRARIIRDDPSLLDDGPVEMEHVIYAAIMEGLRESEREAGVEYDENTGLRKDVDQRQAVLDAINLYGDDVLHKALDDIGFVPRNAS